MQNSDGVISIGRRPDLIVPPNHGAKKGIEQWIWTKDRSRYKYPFSHQYGWVRVFVSNGELTLKNEYYPSLSFLEMLEDLRLDYARSPSLVAFLKETGSQYLGRTSYSSPTPGEVYCGPHDTAPEPPPLICPHPCKLGEIKIIGNELTTDGNILRLLELYRGQSLTENGLKNAKNALIDCGLFGLDEAKRLEPTIQIIDPEGPGEYKDILVFVPERFMCR